MTGSSFDTKLDRYAELTVKVGLNLQPGQRLLINAPILSAPFTRLVAQRAYQIGAPYVDVGWDDEQLNLIRLQYAPRGTFEEYPAYYAQGLLDHARKGGATLVIRSNDPDLLADQNPEDVSTIEITGNTHFKPFHDLLRQNASNWSMVNYPTLSWAKKVYPQLADAECQDRLWQAIFSICRVDDPDPVPSWQSHIDKLQARASYLTHKKYSALRFKGPGTDLVVGLAEGSQWVGGSVTALTGIQFVLNLPTEEIYTIPHRERINGYVTASMPLSRSGTIIEGIKLEFEHGRITQAEASKGEELFLKLIATDEGMGSLGEVALVPHSSPIAQEGILFYDTLLDENAASHLALGAGYRFCLKDAEKISDEEYAARGGNSSLLHIDFMIGSPEMDVNGIFIDGSPEPVMRAGEWAFDL